jgi:hypothetical protein
MRVSVLISLALLILSAACSASHPPGDDDGGLTPDGAVETCGGEVCAPFDYCCHGCTDAEDQCITLDLPCPDRACPPPPDPWTSCEAAMAARAEGEPCEFGGDCDTGEECCFASYACIDGVVARDLVCVDPCGPPPPDRRCGTRDAALCPEGEYCEYFGAGTPAACNVSDGGVCRARPSTCDFLYDPVCGCNGLTYGNACAANAEGVSVRSAGECDDAPVEG